MPALKLINSLLPPPPPPPPPAGGPSLVPGTPISPSAQPHPPALAQGASPAGSLRPSPLGFGIFDDLTDSGCSADSIARNVVDLVARDLRGVGLTPDGPWGSPIRNRHVLPFGWDGGSPSKVKTARRGVMPLTVSPVIDMEAVLDGGRGSSPLRVGLEEAGASREGEWGGRGLELTPKRGQRPARGSTPTTAAAAQSEADWVDLPAAEDDIRPGSPSVENAAPVREDTTDWAGMEVDADAEAEAGQAEPSSESEFYWPPSLAAQATQTTPADHGDQLSQVAHPDEPLRHPTRSLPSSPPEPVPDQPSPAEPAHRSSSAFADIQAVQANDEDVSREVGQDEEALADGSEDPEGGAVGESVAVAQGDAAQEPAHVAECPAPPRPSFPGMVHTPPFVSTAADSPVADPAPELSPRPTVTRATNQTPPPPPVAPRAAPGLGSTKIVSNEFEKLTVSAKASRLAWSATTAALPAHHFYSSARLSPAPPALPARRDPFATPEGFPSRELPEWLQSAPVLLASAEKAVAEHVGVRLETGAALARARASSVAPRGKPRNAAAKVRGPRKSGLGVFKRLDIVVWRRGEEGKMSKVGGLRGAVTGAGVGQRSGAGKVKVQARAKDQVSTADEVRRQTEATLTFGAGLIDDRPVAEGHPAQVRGAGSSSPPSLSPPLQLAPQPAPAAEDVNPKPPAVPAEAAAVAVLVDRSSPDAIHFDFGQAELSSEERESVPFDAPSPDPAPEPVARVKPRRSARRSTLAESAAGDSDGDDTSPPPLPPRLKRRRGVAAAIVESSPASQASERGPEPGGRRLGKPSRRSIRQAGYSVDDTEGADDSSSVMGGQEEEEEPVSEALKQDGVKERQQERVLESARAEEEDKEDEEDEPKLPLRKRRWSRLSKVQHTPVQVTMPSPPVPSPPSRPDPRRRASEAATAPQPMATPAPAAARPARRARWSESTASADATPTATDTTRSTSASGRPKRQARPSANWWDIQNALQSLEAAKPKKQRLDDQDDSSATTRAAVSVRAALSANPARAGAGAEADVGETSAGRRSVDRTRARARAKGRSSSARRVRIKSVTPEPTEESGSGTAEYREEEETEEEEEDEEVEEKEESLPPLPPPPPRRQKPAPKPKPPRTGPTVFARGEGPLWAEGDGWDGLEEVRGIDDFSD